MRRVATPNEKTGKLIAPRKLHNTQWGIVCPAETPEGASVGVVKNLAITTLVTQMVNSKPILDRVMGYDVIPLSEIGDEEDAISWLKKKANLDDKIEVLDIKKPSGLLNDFNLNDAHILKKLSGFLAIWLI